MGISPRLNQIGARNRKHARWQIFGVVVRRTSGPNQENREQETSDRSESDDDAQAESLRRAGRTAERLVPAKQVRRESGRSRVANVGATYDPSTLHRGDSTARRDLTDPDELSMRSAACFE
jgi:hypothetical protein